MFRTKKVPTIRIVCYRITLLHVYNSMDVKDRGWCFCKIHKFHMYAHTLGEARVNTSQQPYCTPQLSQMKFSNSSVLPISRSFIWFLENYVLTVFRCVHIFWKETRKKTDTINLIPWTNIQLLNILEDMVRKQWGFFQIQVYVYSDTLILLTYFLIVKTILFGVT